MRERGFKCCLLSEKGRAPFIALEVGTRHLPIWKHVKPPLGGSDQSSRQNASRREAGLVRRNHRFGRPHFTTSGHRSSLVHCLVGPDVRWSVLGLGWSVWSVRWALFVSETQVAIFCAFLVRSLVFSFVFNLWVPADHNSPNLVEPISNKPYN